MVTFYLFDLYFLVHSSINGPSVIAFRLHETDIHSTQTTGKKLKTRIFDRYSSYDHRVIFPHDDVFVGKGEF